MNRTSIITGIILITVAIVLGAFGAHALKEKLDAAQLSSFEVGVRYQMYHGLALLSLGLAADKMSFSLTVFNRMILIGTIAFCVSIYFLAMKDMIGVNLSFLGPITPLGGTILIIGWGILLFRFIRSTSNSEV